MASAAEISVEEAMVAVGKQARNAGLQLATLDHEQRLKALHAIAEALEANADAIVAANQKDLEAAEGQISSASYNRLKLPKSKLNSAILGVRDVAKLPDPLGAVTLHRKLDENLVLKRFAVPVGVLGIIFESRPDVLIQISCLAIKSGNAVILKGGKESINSCVALGDIIRGALSEAGVDANAVQILTSREEIRGLLELDRYVDLIIPRGSNAFVRYVQTNTRIPVLGHADGICHIFVDEAADRMLEDAAKIVVDSKTQYPSACNAVETLLICEKVAPEFLPLVGAALHAKGVQLRVCEQAAAILQRAESHLPFEAATPEDWSTEYCDLVLAVRVVPDLVAAMAHIRDYGSRHTECILTSDKEAADRFIAGVDAAGVYWNASTRFADGFRYGFGAEVGISTQKMPPRGPVGLEGLVTYKYSLVGSGPSLGDHVVERYAGDDCRPFLHEDLPLEQADKDEQQQ